MENGLLQLKDYLHFLQIERQLSQNTLVSYKKDLTDYLNHLFEIQQIHSLDNVERLHIIIHLRQLKEEGKSAKNNFAPYFFYPFFSSVFVT